MFPVSPPGVMTLPAAVAPRGLGRETVVARPAGAVTGVATAVLPVTPSRLGSAVLGAALNGPPSAAMGVNAGVGAKVTLVIPTRVIFPETATSPGVEARAA